MKQRPSIDDKKPLYMETNATDVHLTQNRINLRKYEVGEKNEI